MTHVRSCHISGDVPHGDSMLDRLQQRWDLIKTGTTAMSLTYTPMYRECNLTCGLITSVSSHGVQNANQTCLFRTGWPLVLLAAPSRSSTYEAGGTASVCLRQVASTVLRYITLHVSDGLCQVTFML